MLSHTVWLEKRTNWFSYNEGNENDKKMKREVKEDKDKGGQKIKGEERKVDEDKHKYINS